MIWLIVGATVPSMLVCWAAAALIRRMGPRWKLVDEPGERKIHTQAMPTGGGLAIWLGVVVPFALGHVGLLIASPTGTQWLPGFVAPHVAGLMQQAPRLWLLLGGGTVLMLLGMVDDLRGLDWKIRFAVQLVVTLVMVRCGWQLSLFLEFLELPPPVGALIVQTLSVLWIVVLVNSFNMLDNMDGLSAGVAAIAAAMLAAVMLVGGDPINHRPQLFVGGFLLVLFGSLVGFLWHNRPPARLFMGDTGSYLVGYLVAMATLTATFTGGHVPRHAILAPLCVLAVPLYDTFTVVLIRLRAGRSPFVGDKSHFSHRLVQLGMTETRAVLTIYLATVTCGLGALLLHQVNGAGACVVLLLVGCVLVLVGILETAGLS